MIKFIKNVWLVIQILFQVCLNTVTVTEEQTSIGKTLVLTSIFDCINKDPFDPSLKKGGLNDLISELNSSSNLSKLKTDTSILAVKLVLKLSKGTSQSECIAITRNIYYNPIGLNTLSSIQMQKRYCNNNCTSILHIQDVMLSIQSLDQQSQTTLKLCIRNDIDYFSSYVISRINIHKCSGYSNLMQSLYTQGYDWQENTGNNIYGITQQQQFNKFQHSQIIIEHINIRNSEQNKFNESNPEKSISIIMIQQSCKTIVLRNIVVDKLNVEDMLPVYPNYIFQIGLDKGSIQANYLDVPNGSHDGKYDVQVDIQNFTVQSGYMKIIKLIRILEVGANIKYQSNYFKAKVVINQFTIDSFKFKSESRSLIKSQLKSENQVVEVKSLIIRNTSLEHVHSILDMQNITKLDEFRLENSTVQNSSALIKTNSIKASNILIQQTIFKDNCKMMDVQYSQSISQWNVLYQSSPIEIQGLKFINNTLNNITQPDNNIFSFKGQQLNFINEIGYNEKTSPTQIQQMKDKYGVKINDVLVQDNQCVLDQDESKCKDISTIYVDNVFNLDINNTHFLSNYFVQTISVRYTAYLQISNVQVNGSGIDYCLANKFNLNQCYTRQVHSVQYFLSVANFYSIQFSNITILNGTFERNIIKVQDDVMIQQTIKNNKIPKVDINGMMVTNKTGIKVTRFSGGSIFLFKATSSIDCMVRNSVFQTFVILQGLYNGNDVAVIAVFDSSSSTFRFHNNTIKNVEYYQRKGLFKIDAREVEFKNCSFKNISNADNKTIGLDLLSTGAILDISVYNFTVDSVDVNYLNSNEVGFAAIRLVKDQSDDCNVDHKRCISSIMVKDSRFEDIMTYQNCQLFRVDFSEANDQSRMVVKNIIGKHIYSLNRGSMFVFKLGNGNQINITDSHFESISSFDGSYFLESINANSKYFVQKRMAEFFFESSQHFPRQNLHLSKIVLFNLTFDQKYHLANLLQNMCKSQINLFKSLFGGNRKNVMGQLQNDSIIYKQLVSMSDHTNLGPKQKQLYDRMRKRYRFKGKPFILISAVDLDMINCTFTNIPSQQGSFGNHFPMILQASDDNTVKIVNNTFMNIQVNQQGLFKIDRSKVEVSRNIFNNIVDRSINGFQWNPNPPMNKYTIFNNSQYYTGTNIQNIKGGLLVSLSQAQVSDNIFKNMRCERCQGMAIYSVKSVIQIIGNRFENNHAHNASCIYIEGNNYNDSILAQTKILKDNVTGIMILNKNQSSISDNQFINNIAKETSSAIKVYQSQSSYIANNIFDGNRAKYGGCIMIDQVYNLEQTNIVYKNRFRNNQANYAGCLYYRGFEVQEIDSNTFISNKAKYFSAETYSYVSKFGLNLKHITGEDKIVFDQYTIHNFPSNKQNIILEFVFYDQNGNEVNMSTLYNQTYSNIVKAYNIQNELHNNRYKDGQIFRYDGIDYKYKMAQQMNIYNFMNPALTRPQKRWVNRYFVTSGSPRTYHTYVFFTDVVRRFSKDINRYLKGMTFNLTFGFKECMIGEYYSAIENYCQICQNGTYSFNISKPCRSYEHVTNMEMSYGGKNTTVKKGSWRKINDTDQIIECAYPRNCVPEPKYPDAKYSNGSWLCSLGHIGAICGSCDNYGKFWDKQYQLSTNDGKCIDCESANKRLYILFIALLAQFLFNLFTVKQQIDQSLTERLRYILGRFVDAFLGKKIRLELANDRIISNKLYCKQQGMKEYPMKLKYRLREDAKSYEVYIDDNGADIQKNKGVFYIDYNEVIPISTLIKILITYTQIATFILNLKGNFSYLKDVKVQDTIVTQPIKKALYSIECFISSWGYSDIPVYIIKDIIFNFSPILMWIGFLLLYLVYTRRFIQKEVYVISITLLILINYPQIVESLVKSISCIDYGGTKYVMADLKYECYTSQYYTVLYCFYIPSLAFYCLVLPIGTIVFLRTNKSHLYEIDFKMKFGFIYQEYNQQSYYMEILKITLKVIVIIAQNFYANKNETMMQIFIVLLVLFFYLMFMIWKKPYSQHTANTIEIMNAFVCLFSIICMASMHVSYNNNSHILSFLYFFMFVAANTYFLYVFFYFFFKEEIKDLQFKFYQIRVLILKKRPNLKNNFLFRNVKLNNHLKYSQKWQKLFKLIQKEGSSIPDEHGHTIVNQNQRATYIQQQQRIAYIQQQQRTAYQQTRHRMHTTQLKLKKIQKHQRIYQSKTMDIEEKAIERQQQYQMINRMKKSCLRTSRDYYVNMQESMVNNSNDLFRISSIELIKKGNNQPIQKINQLKSITNFGRYDKSQKYDYELIKTNQTQNDEKQDIIDYCQHQHQGSNQIDTQKQLDTGLNLFEKKVIQSELELDLDSDMDVDVDVDVGDEKEEAKEK